MKRSAFCAAMIALVLVTCTMTLAQNQTQPLGDYARAVKKAKGSSPAPKDAKVYDNDNLPKTTSISVVGGTASHDSTQNASDQSTTEAAQKSNAEVGNKKDEPQLTPGQSADERQKTLDDWKSKLSGQQEKINKISHELELLQREHQIKAAEFYANTAERVQNPNAFRDEDDKFKAKIADKQKELDDAKSKLTDMQDDARKSGAPNSVIEGDSGKN